jgi:hypothetical protein
VIASSPDSNSTSPLNTRNISLWHYAKNPKIICSWSAVLPGVGRHGPGGP